MNDPYEHTVIQIAYISYAIKSLAKFIDVEVLDTLVTKQAQEKCAQMMTDFPYQGMLDKEIKKFITPKHFLKNKKIYARDFRREFKVSVTVEHIAVNNNPKDPAYRIEEHI